MISAIIPAAGSSRRMNSNVNKQFMSIAGQPVLTRSLLSLREHVGEVHHPLPAGEEELCRECARPYIDNFIVIAGGTTRQDSVYNGLLHCGGDYVLVHDGNRPLVSATWCSGSSPPPGNMLPPFPPSGGGYRQGSSGPAGGFHPAPSHTLGRSDSPGLCAAVASACPYRARQKNSRAPTTFPGGGPGGAGQSGARRGPI